MEYLRKDQLEMLSRTFTLCAREREGVSVVSSKELHTVLNALGLSLTPTDTHALLTQVDVKGKGVLDFPEFVQLLTGQLLSVDTTAELHAVFDAIDSDRDGRISVEDVHSFIHDPARMPDTAVIATPAHVPLSREELEAVFKQVCSSVSVEDADRARTLTREDFLTAMRAQVLTHVPTQTDGHE